MPRPVGYKVTDESKEKIRRYRKGTKHTDETKEKIRQGVLAYWKRKSESSKNVGKAK